MFAKTSNAVVTSRYFISAVIPIVFLLGCEGVQVNVPVEVGPVVKREHAALWVLVENKSTHRIEITYPISTGMLQEGQHTVFHLPRPGNYKVVITAYAEDPYYPDVYQPIKTVEIPIFLNGYDVIHVKDTYVGYYLEVMDGILFPEK